MLLILSLLPSMDSLMLPALYLGGSLLAMSVFSYIYRRLTSKPQLHWTRRLFCVEKN